MLVAWVVLVELVVEVGATVKATHVEVAILVLVRVVVAVVASIAEEKAAGALLALKGYVPTVKCGATRRRIVISACVTRVAMLVADVAGVTSGVPLVPLSKVPDWPSVGRLEPESI